MHNKITLPKISNLFRSTFVFVGKHWKELLLITGLPIGFQSLFTYSNLVLIPLITNANPALVLLYVLFVLLCAVVLPLFFFYSIAASVLYVKNALEGHKGIGRAYKDTFRYIFPFLWALILVDFSFFGASIFFVIPGIIVYVYLQLVLFLVADGKYRGLSALSASFHLIKGIWWKMFGRMLLLVLLDIILAALFIGVSLAGSYVFVHSSLSIGAYIKGNLDIVSTAFTISSWICSIIAMPYYWILYKSVLKAKEGLLVEDEVKKSKNFFMGLSIWGVVGSFLFVFLISGIIFVAALSQANQNANSATSIASAEEDMIATDSSAPMLTYTDSLYGFSINYPQDWQIDSENTNSPYSIFFIAPDLSTQTRSGTGLRGSVVVNITQLPAPQGLEQVSSEYEAEIAYESTTLKDDWTILSKQSTTFLGLPAYQYATTKLRTLDNGKTYVTQKSETYLFVKGDLVYDVEYKNDLTDFDLMKSLGDQMIATLKIR